jgi:hypothetical protein
MPRIRRKLLNIFTSYTRVKRGNLNKIKKKTNEVKDQLTLFIILNYVERKKLLDF